jgi:formate dehydrogenase iron-sulfur subunit
MTSPADKPAVKTAVKTTLIDIGNCIGCRACQVACKQWNDRDGELTELEPDLGFQNPAVLSANTYTLISFHDFVEEAPGAEPAAAYVMRRCLHCLEPACVSACPTTALDRRPDGPVTYDQDPCIGCRYCMLACPWGVPTAEWDSHKPKIEKCTHCVDRIDQPLPVNRNGTDLTKAEKDLHVSTIAVPACVKACPADALVFGEREEMLTEAKKRIARRPDKYVNHIYGEHEAGGTSVLYVSRVPFAKLGFPDVGTQPYTRWSKIALRLVPAGVMAIGAFLGAACLFLKRRSRVMEGSASAGGGGHAHEARHPEFERLDAKLWTPFNWAMLALVAVGLVSFVFRFVFGLGRTTRLSDTYPWGLWIVFDLVWIAIAAGAFATAAVIYVFRRHDLYSIGRAAVFLGLLSYSFVTVTLLADLGLPLHVHQLALNAPGHSAMFEVSWCVGMYVTILLFEVLPVVFERFKMKRAMELWRSWSGVWAAFAVSLFVWMLSRNVAYTLGTAVVFGVLAWIFRARGEKFEPIILAIAAVTLSTMHQSSLGTLFLLTPAFLAPGWWSPVLPISFLLSSIAAGSALVVLVEMAIAKGWRRPLRVPQLASMGQIAFWALLVYLAFRIGDLVVRDKLAVALTGRTAVLFFVEMALGIAPLVLLGSASSRRRPGLLALGCLLAVLGIVLNRINVVLLAMTFEGPMPWTAPSPYTPSIVEWGLSIGLIAATIFLFGLGARTLPLLPKHAATRAD